jgi:hypothetical protein
MSGSGMQFLETQYLKIEDLSYKYCAWLSLCITMQGVVMCCEHVIANLVLGDCRCVSWDEWAQGESSVTVLYGLIRTQ